MTSVYIFSLLNRLGREEIQAMLSRGGDVDLIEEMLRVLYSQTISSTGDAVSELVLWFGLLAGVEKFELTLKFADRSLASSIATFLELHEPSVFALYSGK